MELRRFGLQWRFSLGEVLVAIAIDAILAATILDWVRVLRGEGTSFVCYFVLAVTYLVFPCVVVPLYFATYHRHGRSFRGWQSRRNDFLMVVDVVLVVVALVLVSMNDSNRTRHLQLIYLFIPIAFTMFLAYVLIVESLKRNSRVLAPAQDEAAMVAVHDPSPGESSSILGPSDL